MRSRIWYRGIQGDGFCISSFSTRSLSLSAVGAAYSVIYVSGKGAIDMYAWDSRMVRLGEMVRKST